jgi:membrane protein implicated in regulation of membrane protease activity
MCHILLFAPAFGLLLFWLLPMSVAGPVYVVILLLSILLYVITIRAMRLPQLTGPESLLRKTGQIIDATGRRTRVRIGGEIWEAASSDPLEVGDRVQVVNRDGLMLKVQRLVAGTHRRGQLAK